MVLNFSAYAIFVAPFRCGLRLRDMTHHNDLIPLPMTTKPTHLDLSRRERQIIDILYARGRATAAEVQAALPDPPSYSAVRAMLRILEDKGHVKHEQDGPRYVYVPTVGHDNAKRSALHHMLKTFFDGSTEQAISALLDDSASKCPMRSSIGSRGSSTRPATPEHDHGHHEPRRGSSGTGWLPLADAIPKATLSVRHRRDRIARVAPGSRGRAPSNVDAGAGQRTRPAALSLALPRWQLPLVTVTVCVHESCRSGQSLPQPALESTAIAPAPPRLHTATRTAVTPAGTETSTPIRRARVCRCRISPGRTHCWRSGLSVQDWCCCGSRPVCWASSGCPGVPSTSPTRRGCRWRARWRRSSGVSPRLMFLRSGRAAMPMAWGFSGPAVLMPSDADHWPAERLRIVLLHELAHVKRRDCLTHMLAQIACAALLVQSARVDGRAAPAHRT